MNEAHDIVKNTSEVSYCGDLRTQAIHQRSGSEISTDAPVDNNGKGEAFSPTDLVATALASCILTIMGIVAAKKGFVLPETTAEVKKTMADNPRRISRIQVNVVCSNSNLEEWQIKLLEHSATSCPVAKSLSPELEQVVTFDYN